MIREKINQAIVKTYVRASTDWRYAGFVFFVYVLGASLIVTTSKETFANGEVSGGDDILSVGKEIINNIAGAIIGISTAAAVVGVGTGAFLKKFSLGKMDRIETGNKLIWNSIWGWILVNGLTVILRFFAGYFDQKDSVTTTWSE